MKLIAFILIVCITAFLIFLNKRGKVGSRVSGRRSSRSGILDSSWLPTAPLIRSESLARAEPAPSLIREIDREDSHSMECKSDDAYLFDIVGELHYQSALRRIADSKEKDSKSFKCKAKIIRERSNQYDSNACVVKINGEKVGYISKTDNKNMIAELGEDSFPIEVPALIVGGWKTEFSEGHYGVKLALPANSLPASTSDRAMVRYVEGKAVRGLTQQQVKSRLQQWKKEDNDRFYQWEQLNEITELLQSEDGRLEYSIKKPSAKAIMEAFDELIAEGFDVDDLDADELVERLTRMKPELCR